MTLSVFTRLKIGVQVEMVIQKVPPMNCRMGCPEWTGDLTHPTEICETCCQRPIKSYEAARVIRGNWVYITDIPTTGPYPLDHVWEEKIERMNLTRILSEE